MPTPLNSFIRRESDDRVATLVITRASAKNALNWAVVEQLRAAFREAASDAAVDGVVITGDGGNFVVGADVAYFVRLLEAGQIDRIVQFTRATHELFAEIESYRKPVVAAIDGAALGGGLELALACHVRVATPRATLGFPETSLGIYPAAGGTQRAPRVIGSGLAKWLIYTAKLISGGVGMATGLVDQVVPPAELLAAARSKARSSAARPRAVLGEEHVVLERYFADHSLCEILMSQPGDEPSIEVARAIQSLRRNGPLALDVSERLLDASQTTSLAEGLEMELEAIAPVFATDDARAGLKSAVSPSVAKVRFQGR